MFLDNSLFRKPLSATGDMQSLSYAGDTTITHFMGVNSLGQTVPVGGMDGTTGAADTATLVLDDGSTLAFEDGTVEVLVCASAANLRANLWEWKLVGDAQDHYIARVLPFNTNKAGPDDVSAFSFGYTWNYVLTADVDTTTNTTRVVLGDTGTSGVVMANGVVVRPATAAGRHQFSFAKSTTNITAGQTATITITPLVIDYEKDRIVTLAKTSASVRYSLSGTTVKIPKGSSAAVTVTVTTTAGGAVASTNVTYAVDNAFGGQTGTLTFAIV